MVPPRIFVANIPHNALLEIARDMESSVQKKAEFTILFLDADSTFAHFTGKEPKNEEDEMKPIPMAIEMPEDEEAPTTIFVGGDDVWPLLR